jgi:response regulator RpfG family c-di-GMP phosphodiesterase
MRNHTLAGARILEGSESPLVQMAELIARTHHEKWDGSGYPLGLKGEEIPLAGRITAVCDVFDALVSARHYKAAWRLQDAVAELKRQRGVYFDPQLVNVFVDMVPELPRWLITGGRDADQILRATARETPAQPVPHLKLLDPVPDPDGVPPLHATRPR